MPTKCDDTRTVCAIGLWNTRTRRPDGLTQWVQSVHDHQADQGELASSLLIDAMEKKWAVVVVSEVAAAQGATFSIRGASSWDEVVKGVTEAHIANCHRLGERTLLPVKVMIVDWSQDCEGLEQALASAGMIDLNEHNRRAG